MASPALLDLARDFGGFVAMIAVSIGGWWLKAMMSDVKDLQKEHQKFQIFMAEFREKLSNREQLQDERWKGLQASIATVEHGLNRTQRGIEMILHKELLNPEKEK